MLTHTTIEIDLPEGFGTHQTSLAEAQLLGWNAHRQGTSIVELCDEMGLKPDEWDAIKKQYGLGYMREADKKEIDNHFKK